MKKIKMTLQTNNRIISDNEYMYNLKDGYIVINYDNLLLKFKLEKDNFIFIRETNEDMFQIINNKGKIFLKEFNQSFDIELSKCNYKKENNKHEIEYLIEGDDTIIKIKLEEKN